MPSYLMSVFNDTDMLIFLQNQGYTTLTGFVANNDGTFTLTSSEELDPEDLHDINDIMINIDIWQQVEL